VRMILPCSSMTWLLGFSSLWPDETPTGISLSPICLKMILLAARLAAVAWMEASLASQSCCIESTVTTSAAVWERDFLRACAAAAGPISCSSASSVATAELDDGDLESLSVGRDEGDCGDGLLQSEHVTLLLQGNNLGVMTHCFGIRVGTQACPARNGWWNVGDAEIRLHAVWTSCRLAL